MALAGRGIEIGAHNDPLDVSGNPGIEQLLYVDRLSKGESLRLFPELVPIADRIVETDVRCDVIQGLTPFQRSTLDFVIAAHIVEHVPDPIFFMKELRRVLKPGGRLFLAVPDQEQGVDYKRAVTPLEHLVEDHARRVSTLEDHHLEDFLRLAENLPIPEDAAERERLFALHRARSVHIHVWNYAGFSKFLLYCLGVHTPFRLLEAGSPWQNERHEMLFLLEACERSQVDLRAAFELLGAQLPLDRRLGFSIESLKTVWLGPRTTSRGVGGGAPRDRNEGTL